MHGSSVDDDVVKLISSGVLEFIESPGPTAFYRSLNACVDVSKERRLIFQLSSASIDPSVHPSCQLSSCSQSSFGPFIRGGGSSAVHPPIHHLQFLPSSRHFIHSLADCRRPPPKSRIIPGPSMTTPTSTCRKWKTTATTSQATAAGYGPCHHLSRA